MGLFFLPTLLACYSSVTSLPPPIPLPEGRGGEVGCGAVWMSKPDTGYGGACHATFSRLPRLQESIASDAGPTWEYWQPERYEMGVNAHYVRGDDFVNYGLGLMNRFWFLEGDRVAMGGQLDVGTFWIHASLPLSVRPLPGVRLYTRPGWQFLVGGFVPVGMSVVLGDLFLLSGEFRSVIYRDYAVSGGTDWSRMWTTSLALTLRPRMLRLSED